MGTHHSEQSHATGKIDVEGLRMRVTTPPRTEGRGLGTSWRAGSWPALAVTAALLLVFWLDRATGAAPVQHLYYLPIIGAAMTGGLTAGVPALAAAIVLYHVANPRLLTFAYGEWDIVQVLLFVAVGVATAKLAEDRTRLHQLSVTDDLTGLSNLRSFEERLLTLVRASRDEASGLALLVLDLDRLKALNDAHGHLAGAEAVRTVGRLIADRVPANAVACRYGGDEFVVALPQCTEAGAHHVADDIRQGVHDAAPVLANVQFSGGALSVSIGLAFAAGEVGRREEDASTVGEALFRAADTALYRAKAAGRNQVCRVPYSLIAGVS